MQQEYKLVLNCTNEADNWLAPEHHALLYWTASW
jgi:hypothetical protein